jgi:hypothetical protein
MPNIPLPPLQARLQQQNMITPIVKGTPTPMDVIQHQQLIDYMARFKEGIDAAQDLSRSRMVAKQSAAQAHAADVQGRENKNLDDYLSKIDKSKMSPADKMFFSNMAIYQSGFSGDPYGGSISGQNTGEIYRTFLPTWSQNPPAGGVAETMRKLVPSPQFDASGNVVAPQSPSSTVVPPAPIKPNVVTPNPNPNQANGSSNTDEGDADQPQFY